MIPFALRSPLTERQTEILQLLADGLAQKEVAYRLGITRQTVKNHIYGNGGTAGITERLGKTTLHGAVAEAMRYMWVV